jgi:hypothetical protein
VIPTSAVSTPSAVGSLPQKQNNPDLRESLTMLAHNWARMATELEAVKRLLDEWGDPIPNLDGKPTAVAEG